MQVKKEFVCLFTLSTCSQLPLLRRLVPTSAALLLYEYIQTLCIKILDPGVKYKVILVEQQKSVISWENLLGRKITNNTGINHRLFLLGTILSLK
jgi:hypothetical protein